MANITTRAAPHAADSHVISPATSGTLPPDVVKADLLRPLARALLAVAAEIIAARRPPPAARRPPPAGRRSAPSPMCGSDRRCRLAGRLAATLGAIGTPVLM